MFAANLSIREATSSNRIKAVTKSITVRKVGRLCLPLVGGKRGAEICGGLMPRYTVRRVRCK